MGLFPIGLRMYNPRPVKVPEPREEAPPSGLHKEILMDSRPPERETRPWTFAAIAMVACLLLTTVALVPTPQLTTPQLVTSSIPTRGNQTLDTQLQIDGNIVVGEANREFWGVDLYPQPALTSLENQELVATGIHYVVWPGGKLNDEYDVLTNVVHLPNGTTFSPQTNISEFVAWCKASDCHAILGIPGEINRPNFIASEVEYVEKTLHFHPAYWEIGNEPGLWGEYNIPWNRWSAAQASPTTPEKYAYLVQRYIATIRGIDPKARIIGLSGTGMGAYLEPTWVYDSLRVNKHNISAVALHVYPAGHLTATAGNLTEFDQSLSGKASLDVRVPLVRQAIHSACSTCHPQVIVTEYNAATVGALTGPSNYGTFMDGFDEVPYVAAEVTQGLLDRVRNMDLWTFGSGYPGAMVAPNGTVRPLYYLYATILTQLDVDAVRTSFSGDLGQFYGVASEPTSGSAPSMTLFLVNANPSTSVDVNLVGSGLPLTTGGSAWTYAQGMTQPVAISWLGQTAGNWTLAPESVVLIEVA